MNYTVHVKTEFVDLELREVLQSPPSVLQGVSPDAAATLLSMRIGTVYDLGLSSIFGNAARVVDAATDPSSVLAQAGHPTSDLIVPSPATPAADWPAEPVQTLVGVSAALSAAFDATMSVSSVRDLAQWPPYLAAVKLVTDSLAPQRAVGYDRDEPPDLVPRSGDLATHRVRYTSTVLIESKPSRKTAWSGGVIDVTALPQVGFNDVAYGAILHFNQTWSPKAVALGQLLHSLPLAPGESTRVTVVDWLRRVAASTTEEEAQSEDLSNAMSNSTAISEVTSAVAHEFQSGDSFAGSSSTSTSASTPGLLGLLGGQASGGATFGTAGTYSTSSGSRSVSGSALQSIDARTQQNSALTRTKRAAIVSEVSESDSESINTRVLINNNHMHALSIQYYEVVQTWETELRLDLVERCIFIPMRLVNFRNEQMIRRYLPILIRSALDRETRDLLLQLRHTVVLEFPFERFASTAIRDVLAQVQTAVEQDAAPPAAGKGLPAQVARQVALAADVEKRLLVQQLQSRISALRSSLRAEEDMLVQRRLFESYDRSSQARFEIDREAVLTNVAWDTSGISKVTLQLADGATQQLTASGDRAKTGVVHPSLGVGLTLDSLRSIQVTVDAAPDANPSDYSVVRVWLLLQLRTRATWVDFSFVVSRHQAADVTLLQAHPPVDVDAIATRLMSAQLYYSQSIWMRADRQSLIMQLTPYVCEVGKNKKKRLRVVDYIDPVPITVAGNYVAFRFTYEGDKEWLAWKAREIREARPRVSLVPLPTGGVFAEAVLGEFNSAERLDATRFWRWEESVIPNLAPDIAAAQQGLHSKIGAPSVTALPDSVLSLQTPLALPALGGTEALLKTLMVSKLFNDMSGVDITRGLLKASIEAARDGDLATMKQANDTLKAITDSFGKLLKSGTDGGQNMINTAKGLGSLLNMSDKGGTAPAGGNAAGSAIDAGTAADAGSASGLGDFVGGGAEGLAAVGGDMGSVLEAVGPVAAALLA